MGNQQIHDEIHDTHSENKENGNRDEFFDKVAFEKSSPNEADLKIENCTTKDENVFATPESIEDFKEVLDNAKDLQEIIEDKIEDLIVVQDNIDDDKDVSEKIGDGREVLDKIEDVKK